MTGNRNDRMQQKAMIILQRMKGYQNQMAGYRKGMNGYRKRIKGYRKEMSGYRKGMKDIERILHATYIFP